MKRINKLKIFYKESIKNFVWIILLINLWFWQGRLKAMWIYGEAIMAEPNKIISFSEWIMASALVIWIALICFRKYWSIFEDLFKSPTSQTSPNGDFSNEKEHNISLKENQK